MLRLRQTYTTLISNIAPSPYRCPDTRSVSALASADSAAPRMRIRKDADEVVAAPRASASQCDSRCPNQSPRITTDAVAAVEVAHAVVDAGSICSPSYYLFRLFDDPKELVEVGVGSCAADQSQVSSNGVVAVAMTPEPDYYGFGFVLNYLHHYAVCFKDRLSAARSIPTLGSERVAVKLNQAVVVANQPVHLALAVIMLDNLHFLFITRFHSEERLTVPLIHLGSYL